MNILKSISAKHVFCVMKNVCSWTWINPWSVIGLALVNSLQVKTEYNWLDKAKQIKYPHNLIFSFPKNYTISGKTIRPVAIKEDSLFCVFLFLFLILVQNVLNPWQVPCDSGVYPRFRPKEALSTPGGDAEQLPVVLARNFTGERTSRVTL